MGRNRTTNQNSLITRLFCGLVCGSHFYKTKRSAKLFSTWHFVLLCQNGCSPPTSLCSLPPSQCPQCLSIWSCHLLSSSYTTTIFRDSEVASLLGAGPVVSAHAPTYLLRSRQEQVGRQRGPGRGCVGCR